MNTWVESIGLPDMEYFASLYEQSVRNLTKDAGKTHLGNAVNIVSLSEKLGRLTQTALAFVGKIEQSVDDFELDLSKADFYVRNEYSHQKNILYT